MASPRTAMPLLTPEEVLSEGPLLVYRQVTRRQ